MLKMMMMMSRLRRRLDDESSYLLSIKLSARGKDEICESREGWSPKVN